MKRLLGVLVLPLLMPVSMPALAQTGVQCAAIAEDGARLACYDGLFRTTGESGAGQSARVESEQLIPARPSGRAPATITVSCEAGVLQVAFGFAGNTISALGRDAGITLQYDLQRRSSTLPVDADNTAIVIDNSRDARTFLEGLAGVTNLTVRVTPANTRTLSARFRVADITGAAAPVAAACTP